MLFKNKRLESLEERILNMEKITHGRTDKQVLQSIEEQVDRIDKTTHEKTFEISVALNRLDERIRKLEKD